MPTTTYTVIAGEVIEENRGGTIRGYMPDTVGSTIALLNSSQTMTDTWVYWPFGEVKTRTGSTQTPFAFIGQYQARTHSALVFFNPAYKPSLGKWINSPKAKAVPVTDADCPDPGDITCNSNQAVYDFCNCCYSLPDYLRYPCEKRCDYVARQYYLKCKGIPGDNSFAPPGPYGPGMKPGIVAPRPKLFPYSVLEDCISGGTRIGGVDCVGSYNDMNKCTGYAIGKTAIPHGIVLFGPPHPDPEHIFHLGWCYDCCMALYSSFSDPVCKRWLRECAENCSDHAVAWGGAVVYGVASAAKDFFEPSPNVPKGPVPIPRR